MARSSMTTPFVAREKQVALLRSALERAGEGRPSALLLGGDAGVGKTRLLSHLADLARACGATPVTSHCVDLGEVGLPYLPFAEAIAQLRQIDPEVERLTVARPELRRLLPSAAGGLHGPVDEQTVRLQLFDGIAAALAAAGRPGAPVVLIIEDLHWADSSSRDVLRFLIARLRDEHVLIVASYRTDDLHRRHPLRPMLAELWRHPRVERLDLPAFTEDELREFTAAVLGRSVPEATLRSISERSEGNAYFAEELLESGGDEALVPGTLTDVLRARLEGLEPAVQRLARIASVAGRRVSEDLLRAVVGALDGSGSPVEPVGGAAGDALDEALRDAVAHHVLMGEDGRIAFRHALLAEVVYADLLPGEQVALHRAYLGVMSAHPALGPASSVATHALQAHDLPAAVRASHAAAHDAGLVLAPAEELRHLETVLRLWDAVADAEDLVGEDRVGVLARAAGAASRAGEQERAVALAREAVEALGTSKDDRARRATVRTMLARHLLGTERGEEGLAEAAAALADLGSDASPADRAWALATHARACLIVDRDEDAQVSATQAVQAARAGGVAAAEADALATLAVLVVDDPASAAALLTAARQRAVETGDVVTEQRCAYNLATTHYYAGHLEEAAAALSAGLARSGATGLTWSEFGLSLRFFDELVRYTRGDLSDGAAAAQPAPGNQAALLGAVRLYAAVARGEHDHVLALRPKPGEWSADGQIVLITGGCTIDALTWSGEPDAAVQLSAALLDHLGRTWTDYFLGGIWLAALGLAALADQAEADRLSGVDPALRIRRGDQLLHRAVTTAERGRPRGGRLGPEGLGWLARAHAEHARLVGHNDPTLWRAATEAFAYGYRYEEARSRFRWAQALLEAGDRDAARAQAGAALAEARAMGAAPLDAALVDLVRRGRLDLPGVTRPATELLTSREVEVLTLVAEGLSNRQIGERLFISGKTVSVHVSNVLAKLGVSGRAQAVSVAHHRGLLGAGTGAVAAVGTGRVER